MTQPTIQALASRGATEPENLSALEVARLAFYILDHQEHIASWQALAKPQAAPRPADPLPSTLLARLGDLPQN